MFCGRLLAVLLVHSRSAGLCNTALDTVASVALATLEITNYSE